MSTEDSSTGVSWAKSSTPSARMMVVTMEVVAMAMVEMTSPSSLPGFTLAASMELIAAGAFRLVMLPVTKAR